jgi:DNA repair protein SbcC/Rad50
VLRQPLEQRRKEEIISREALIAEVAALDPQQRSSTDQLKTMQERWQAQASSVPLRRKDEQALWEKFRAACDHLFAQRKLASGEADAQRKENLAVKTALCLVLEEAISASDTNLSQLLQQTATTWKNIGLVPRADESAIEQRYQTAVLAIKQHGQHVLNQRNQLSKTNYLNKLSLCQSVESMLVQEANDEERLQKLAPIKINWQQSGDLSPALSNAMQLRFESALGALDNNDPHYRALLQKNSVEFDAALLRLEIVLGIDSPLELSRERLQMQVEVLQTSLKRGTESSTKNDTLQRLLTIAVVLDPAKQHRLEKVLSVSDAI